MPEAAIADPLAGLARGVTGPGWHWLAPAAEMAAACDGWPLAAQAGGGFPRVATRTPGPGPSSVRAARDFAVGTLRRWGIGDRCDDIVVVVSELLTNALRHARPAAAAWPCSPVRLGLVHPGPYLVCAVADPSDQPPQPREPGWFDETGRGLHVVGSLSDGWGYTPPTRRGKVVWARFVNSSGW